MSKQGKIKKDFLLPDCKNENYLQKISQIVSKHRGKKLRLNKVEKFTFRVGSFKNTWFKDEPDLLKKWEQFYLPDHMFMEVIGVLENFYHDELSNELVLMVCEDGNVYAYEDEHLHLVANNLTELFECGVQFPGIKQYYSGQRFQDMEDDECNEKERSQRVTETSKKNQDMFENMKIEFLKSLEYVDQILSNEDPEGLEVDQPSLAVVVMMNVRASAGDTLKDIMIIIKGAHVITGLKDNAMACADFLGLTYVLNLSYPSRQTLQRHGCGRRGPSIGLAY